MKRIVLLLLIMLIIAPCQVWGDSKETNALSLINHVNWVVSKIVTTKSKIVLEDEYDGISADGLYLDCIQDSATVSTIKLVMQTITDARLNQMERDFLKKMYDEDKKYLIYEAIPNPTAIISPDIKSIAINLASSVVTGQMRYKQAERGLKRRFDQSVFELDKNQITYLNTLNMELLQKHYDLIHKYQLPDQKRITVKTLEDLNKRINDRDVNYEVRTYEFLRLHESLYRFLPDYWYYRGLYAGLNGKKNDELNAYNQYQKIHFHFLRYDKIAAAVAMRKCRLLLERNSWWNKDEIEHQLQIILKNAKSSDWEFHYFCGLVYLHQLSKPELATTCLQRAVNYLDFSFSSQVNKYYGHIDDGVTEITNVDGNWLGWNATALAVCRKQLLQAMLKCKSEEEVFEYFQNMLKNNTLSAFEFFPYFAKSGLYDAKFLEYIKTSALCHVDINWLGEDSLRILIPMRFFYSGFYRPDVIFSSYGSEKGKIIYKQINNLFLWDNGLRYQELGGPKCYLSGFEHYNMIYRCIKYDTLYEFDVMQKRKIDCIDVVFKNQYHTITIRYASPTSGVPPAGIEKRWVSPTHIICDGNVIELSTTYPTLTKDRAIEILKDACR